MRANTLIFAVAGIVCVSSAGAVPGLMNYQGKLTGADGRLAAGGPYEMAFAIYDQASGGAALWTETRDGAEAVQVTGGIFNIALGEVEPLDLPFDAGYWLEVRVKSGGWQTLLPRQRIASAGYAFRALEADGVRAEAVTADSIADGAVTAAKLDVAGLDPATGRVTGDGSGLTNVIPVPVVTNIDPATRVEGYPSFTATVSGQHFQIGSRGRIGEIGLAGEDVANSSELSATVPAGIAPGVYDIHVCNSSFQWGTGAGLFAVITRTPTPTATPTATPTTTPTSTPTNTPTPTCALPKTDLVSYYKLDETSGVAAADSHGGGDGTATTTAVFTSQAQGILDTGADFTSEIRWISAPSQDFTRDFSISFWIKTDGTGSSRKVFLKQRTGGSSNSYLHFIVDDDGLISGIVCTPHNHLFADDSSDYFDPGVARIDDNEFHHVVIVLDYANRNFKVYVDNQLMSDDTNMDYVGFSGGSPNNLFFGGQPSTDWQGDTATNGFNGILDEVAIYTRLLSAQEVETLYNGGSGLEYY